jgi:hypothetical protein
MTTSQSPLRVLKDQSDRIAKMLKSTERGEPVADDRGGKIAASLAKGDVKFGVVMDDKILTIEMQWSAIRDMSEVALSEWILKYMRGKRDDA